jgi:hypothetical protein
MRGMLALTYLGKRVLARVRDHHDGQRGNGLFLNVSFGWFARFGTRVEQLERSFDDRVEVVGYKRVPFDAFTKVDKRGGRVCIDTIAHKSATSLLLVILTGTRRSWLVLASTAA